MRTRWDNRKIGTVAQGLLKLPLRELKQPQRLPLRKRRLETNIWALVTILRFLHFGRILYC